MIIIATAAVVAATLAPPIEDERVPPEEVEYIELVAEADAPTAAEVVAASLLADLPDGSSALVLAIEHLWAVPLRNAVRDAGGVVSGTDPHPEELITFGMDVGDEIELEAAEAESDSTV